ncbi:MAG: hypothetical protein ACR2P0_02015 [Acidimicrobiales bacterium]
MNDELRDRLEEMASAPTPRVDGAFANRLEADLRASTPSPSDSHHPRLFDWLLRPGAIVVAAALIVGVVTLTRSDPAMAVEMFAAEGTTVSIPGADSITDGAAGLELPDGSRIDVGPAGRAIVAGVVLEAGATAMIVDGTVEIVDAGPSRTDAPAETDRPSTTAVGPAITDRPNDSDVATDSTAAGRPTTTAPDRDAPPQRDTTSTVEPDPILPADGSDSTVAPSSTTIPPDTTTTAPAPTDPPASTTQPPPTTTVDSPAPVELAVGLEASRIRDGQTTLFWNTRGDTSEISGWVVRARVGDSSEVIAVIRQADVRRLRVTVTDDAVEFRVIARSGEGEVLAASRLVAPTTP